MEIEKLNLHPEHLLDLKKSGLSDETIAMMKVYSVRPADIPKALGWNPSGVDSVLAFPYLKTEGFVRYKTFPPLTNQEGHTVKYLQKKGSGVHLYILPSLNDVLQNPSMPLAVGEGEKKTAALIQAGIPAVGVGGIWNWIDGTSHEVIQEFDEIAWVERDVRLYFDSDIWHRPDLLKPVYALGKELENRGARLQVVVIEQSGQDKVGIDDFLVVKGRESLANLKAVPLTHKVFSQAASWWKRWSSKKSIMLDQKDRNLKTAIQAIRKTPSDILKSFEKKQAIASLVLSFLLDSGKLYITPEQQGYYFDNSSSSLLSLADDVFPRFLSDITGLNPTETEFKYLFEQVKTETKRRGNKTAVHYLARYNPKSHKLYISDFDCGMWVLDGKEIIHQPNGHDEILFVTSSLTIPYKYLPFDKRMKGGNVSDFLNPINCDPQALLTPGELKYQLYIWLLSIFFPELHPTKIIPAFIGPQGSTKTTTARRFGILIMGERFNVGHLEASDRGEQSFIATVCGKPFAAFDNADAPIKWLPDRLATFATGHEFELRELYTTNQLAIHKPTAHVVLTSRDPHFRRPDVAERLLIVKLTRPQGFIPESEVVTNLMKYRDNVWSDLLDTLNLSLNALRNVPESPRMNFRMADFASFGWRISKANGGEESAKRFNESLVKLEKEQAAYTTEEDPVTLCLAIWLKEEQNYNREIDTGTLYSELSKIAQKEGLLLPKTAAAFGKRIRQAKKAIEMTLDIRIFGAQTTHTSRWRFLREGESVTENFFENPLPAQPPLPGSLFDGEQEVQGGKKAKSAWLED
ncbi:MAG: DUF3854 domain-containing protein [Candidatus Omnitrophica bacterium]|nr:DUF3854 domain-containing protein [Candidatus Omnitrophota bacterium]